jgi:hypothetical protein
MHFTTWLGIGRHDAETCLWPGASKKVESREKKRLKDGQKNSTEKSPDAQA